MPESVKRWSALSVRTVFLVLFALFLAAFFQSCGVRTYTEEFFAMDTFMVITVYGDDETVELVKEALKSSKEDRFTGLYSLPLLKLAYTVFPQAIAEFAIKLGYTNPYIGMSNIGIINPDEVTLNGAAPSDAFYSGAIKFKPYMQLALTTFRNEITFSTAVRVTDSEEKIFREFLDKVVEELTAFAEGKN